jgi:hypothetical protein
LKIKAFIAFSIVVIFASRASAQRDDFGLWVGGANYFGDLNAQTSLRFINPAGGVFYRRNFDDRVSARFSVNAGHVWADDAYANNYYQQTRNLGFASNIYEASAQIEFNFLPYTTIPYSSMNAKHKFTPYLLAGFGVFHFNPTAVYNGEKVRLQPLGTEGQGYPQYPDLHYYKRTSSAFIIGGGFKIRTGRLTGITLEAAVRKTATDYLDDVSGVYADPTVLLHEGGAAVAFLADPSVEVVSEPVGATGKMRGDSSKSDDYILIGIGFSYTLKPYRCPYQK